jgi:hypothetical protein
MTSGFVLNMNMPVDSRDNETTSLWWESIYHEHFTIYTRQTQTLENAIIFTKAKENQSLMQPENLKLFFQSGVLGEARLP